IARLAEHWGEVNVVHAFREGNTRSQVAFFTQLCAEAGYILDGAYLQTHERGFNEARASAMLTADSRQFADFLAKAVKKYV
ncbi:MAG: Fic/DOC family protein, partial [Angustibacter sp.]